MTFRCEGRVVCFQCFVQILHGDILEGFRRIRVVPNRTSTAAKRNRKDLCETCLAIGPTVIADGYRLCVACATSRIGTLPC